MPSHNDFKEGPFFCKSWMVGQRMEGGKNRIFGVFEAFFDLYTPQKRRKHDTSQCRDTVGENEKITEIRLLCRWVMCRMK